jgi:hypothetical protein
MNISDSPERTTWQSRPIAQILAVIVVYVPLYVFALWTHLSGRTLTLKELFLYPLLFGGGGVVLVLLMLRFVCGERLAGIQRKPGSGIAHNPLLIAIWLGPVVWIGVAFEELTRVFMLNRLWKV